MKEWKGKIIIDEKKQRVIAVSKYKGNSVRGVAKCGPDDKFDIEKGETLAIARCLKKIAQKRYADIQRNLIKAQIAAENAKARYNKMSVKASEYYHEMLAYEDNLTAIEFDM